MITENLFEARFRTVQELARLGADARDRRPPRHGPRRRRGSPARRSRPATSAPAPPWSIAGLVADGVTTVSGAHHVDRGYAGFAEAMQGLGADVTREPDDAPYA